VTTLRLVVAEFYEELAAEMEASAQANAERLDATVTERVVTHATARQLSAVSLDRDTPVTVRDRGLDMSVAEAHKRVENGARAVREAVGLVEMLSRAAENG